MATSSIPSPYEAAHKTPNGPDDARPTALQIISDNGLQDNGLADKTILVTGGTDGLGLESVRAFASAGARVFFTARNEAKAKQTLQALVAENTDAKIEWIRMDNSSLESVKAGAEVFMKKSKTLNVLLCNAGVGNMPRGETADGFELHFGVNHLAHFYLFQLLKPLLLASSTSAFHSRAVTVSSNAHAFSTVQMGNYNLETLPKDGIDPLVASFDPEYIPMVGYGQSKTANIWFANEIERRYSQRGVHGLSVHPGVIWTNGYEAMDPRAMELLKPFFETEMFQRAFKSKQQGAATQVLAAVGKDYEGKGGLYLDDCSVARSLPDSEQIGLDGYRAWAFNPAGEARLWKDSLEMVGLEDD